MPESVSTPRATRRARVVEKISRFDAVPLPFPHARASLASLRPRLHQLRLFVLEDLLHPLHRARVAARDALALGVGRAYAHLVHHRDVLPVPRARQRPRQRVEDVLRLLGHADADVRCARRGMEREWRRGVCQRCETDDGRARARTGENDRRNVGFLRSTRARVFCRRARREGGATCDRARGRRDAHLRWPARL